MGKIKINVINQTSLPIINLDSLLELSGIITQTTLSASVTANGNTINNTLWEQIEGDNLTIVTPNNLITSINTLSPNKVYKFRFIVYYNGGIISSNITVKTGIICTSEITDILSYTHVDYVIGANELLFYSSFIPDLKYKIEYTINNTTWLEAVIDAIGKEDSGLLREIIRFTQINNENLKDTPHYVKIIPVCSINNYGISKTRLGGVPSNTNFPVTGITSNSFNVQTGTMPNQPFITGAISIDNGLTYPYTITPGQSSESITSLLPNTIYNIKVKINYTQGVITNWESDVQTITTLP